MPYHFVVLLVAWSIYPLQMLKIRTSTFFYAAVTMLFLCAGLLSFVTHRPTFDQCALFFMAIVYTVAMIYSFATGLALRKIVKTIPESVKIESISTQTGIVRIISQTGAIEYIISDPAFKKLRPQGLYFRPSQRAIAARELRIAESLSGHEGLLFRHASSNRAVIDVGGQTLQLRSFVTK